MPETKSENVDKFLEKLKKQKHRYSQKKNSATDVYACRIQNIADGSK